MGELIYKIIQGHVLEVLREMPDGVVDCVVTSPPYYGLRSYGMAPLVWDGERGCSHRWGEEIPGDPRGGSGPNAKEAWAKEEGETEGKSVYARRVGRGNFCLECGGWRGSLGNEPSPEMYIGHLVTVGNEIRRVLRPTGVFFLNLGDSYASQGGPEPSQSKWQVEGASRTQNNGRSRTPGGLKPKDRIGIPWMAAFALRSSGWWLRSEIIWAKGCSFGPFHGNPMPESVCDRPTRSHEQIFLFSQSGENLLWRHSRTDAWKETEPEPDYVYVDRSPQPITGNQTSPSCYNGPSFTDGKTLEHQAGRPSTNPRGARQEQREEPANWKTELLLNGTRRWSRINLWQAYDYYWDKREASEPLVRPDEADRRTPGKFGGADKYREASKMSRLHSGNEYKGTSNGRRNIRDVWTISTQAYKGAHFACWPPSLVEPMILAGCPRSGIVLDPFCGSGATLMVALEHGRSGIGIELNPSYCEMAEKRIMGSRKARLMLAMEGLKEKEKE